MTEPAVKFDFTEEEAIGELTGFDIEAIRKKFGRDLSELGSEAVTAATWCLLNRDGRKVELATVKAMSLRQMKAHYRAAEDDPDSDTGKDGKR